ncbi:MAG: DUF3575 domain-containing protein [Dysgonamonadaceae bacterium]|jgi:hypothetical protein|nr:DUF3575 domain-containing protein [Dysgonamonadaceae bacterium]
MGKHKLLKNTGIALWICLVCLHYNVVVSYAQNNANIIFGDTVRITYADVSVAVNRNISVWKNVDFPSVFYFPIDKYVLLRDYKYNASMLNSLDKLVQSKQVLNALDTIQIIGACSPVGSEEYNMKLALNRCRALRTYLQQTHPQLVKDFPVKFKIIGIDTLGYNILREQKPELTQKQIWDKLQYAAICLKMKNGSCIIPDIISDNIPEEVNISEVVEQQVVIRRDTVFIQDTIITEIHIQKEIEIQHEIKSKPSKPLFIALKTNLIYDAALLPNLTAELYLGKQWSVAVEGNWSWWTFGNPVQNRWFHRVQVAGVELRRWFTSPYPLHGHALGVYAMIGNYDIRFFPKDEYSIGELSYQSWSGGISYAYSFPIARRFNLELGVAAGYVGGRYYKYNYCMEDKQWEQQAVYDRKYIGPTRVGVSLVWLLGTGNPQPSKGDF